MNVCKIIACDIKQGIFKNKRFLLLPILCFFEYMYYDNWVLMASVGRPFGKANLADLFVLMFGGCDPISKIPNRDVKIDLPYYWIALFVFAVFIGFEYMHDDLTQFGIQVVTRCNKRSSWWYSKCLWCALQSLAFYAITLGMLIIYVYLNGYKFTLENNYLITNSLGGLVTVPELEIPDDGNTYLYRTIILICVLISIAAGINFIILFHYIMLKRRRMFAIFRLCGASSARCTAICIFECLILSVPVYIISTLIYDKFITTRFGNFYPYMKAAGSLKIYIVLGLIYIGITTLITMIMLIKNTSSVSVVSIEKGRD